MRRMLLTVSLLLTVVASTADATTLRAHARNLRTEVIARFGHRAPGRDVVRWGDRSGHQATRAEITRYVATLQRMLHPPPRVMTAPTSAPPASAPATSATPTASSGSLPSCTWQPESGGDPHAVNPSSGAGGYYQIMPSTWAAYGGTGAPQNASLSEQTAVAQRVWAAQGPGAWTNC